MKLGKLDYYSNIEDLLIGATSRKVVSQYELQGILLALNETLFNDKKECNGL